jgi:hypothetical protein
MKILLKGRIFFLWVDDRLQDFLKFSLCLMEFNFQFVQVNEIINSLLYIK